MADYYGTLVNTIQEGGSEPGADLMLNVREYELVNNGDAIPSAEFQKMADSVGFPDSMAMRSCITALRTLDFLEYQQRKNEENGNSWEGFYLTSFEDDGAVQYLLDNGLEKRGRLEGIVEKRMARTKAEVPEILKTDYVTDPLLKRELPFYIKGYSQPLNSIGQIYNMDHDTHVDSVRIMDMIRTLAEEDDTIRLERRNGNEFICRISLNAGQKN